MKGRERGDIYLADIEFAGRSPQGDFQFLYSVTKKLRIFFFTYEVKILEFRKSEATCNHKTFDFTYWGTFSAQNSEVFVQTKFFLFLADPWLFQKSAFKKIFKLHFSPRGAKTGVETKLSQLVLTHHFVPCPKKIFSNNFKFFYNFLLNKYF